MLSHVEEPVIPGVCWAPSARMAAVPLPRGSQTTVASPCPPADTAHKAKGQKCTEVKLEETVGSVQKCHAKYRCNNLSKIFLQLFPQTLKAGFRISLSAGLPLSVL